MDGGSALRCGRKRPGRPIIASIRKSHSPIQIFSKDLIQFYLSSICFVKTRENFLMGIDFLVYINKIFFSAHCSNLVILCFMHYYIRNRCRLNSCQHVTPASIALHEKIVGPISVKLLYRAVRSFLAISNYHRPFGDKMADVPIPYINCFGNHFVSFTEKHVFSVKL